MDYEDAVKQLREKIEELQHVNMLLRDELAVALNKDYVYEAKQSVLAAENEHATQMMAATYSDNVAQLQNELNACQAELELIKGSNMYKLWIAYGRMPKPFHKLIRGLAQIAKSVYHSLRKVLA